MADSPSTCPRCGAQLPAADASCVACALGLGLDPAPNPAAEVVVHYLGDYELLEKIAAGGAATVWRARQRSLNREVAVKVLHGGALASPVAQARLRLEAESVARLEHAGIVPIYEVGEHEGSPYFSMRYLRGGSLAQARGGFAGEPRAAATLVLKVARAVHHAHQRGVIHRDLKPGNILLDAAGEPSVGDFGLARWLASEASLTATEQLVGTPAYMSPEQARGQEVFVATDVWSLGVILYELLVGRPPFTGTPLEILEKVRNAEPPPLPVTTPCGASIPPNLAQIVLKCLRRQPSVRYDGAKELADDLENWLDGRPVQARPVSRLVRTAMWMRRHPWQLAVWALLPIPFVVIGVYVVLINCLSDSHETEKWVDNLLTMAVRDESGTRCTLNFEVTPLWGRTATLGLEITNVPAELAAPVRVRIFGDRGGWPDRPRSEVLAPGQVFEFTLPRRNKYWSERSLYFQEADGWQAGDLLSKAPNAQIVLRQIPPARSE